MIIFVSHKLDLEKPTGQTGNLAQNIPIHMKNKDITLDGPRMRLLAGSMVLSSIDECLSNVDEPQMFTVGYDRILPPVTIVIIPDVLVTNLITKLYKACLVAMASQTMLAGMKFSITGTPNSHVSGIYYSFYGHLTILFFPHRLLPAIKYSDIIQPVCQPGPKESDPDADTACYSMGKSLRLYFWWLRILFTRVTFLGPSCKGGPF